MEFGAVFRDGSGRVVSSLPNGASLVWKTFSTTVARIQGSGQQAELQALKPGRTTIQVSLGSLTATADIVVSPVPAQVVSVGAPVALGKAGEIVPDPPRVQVLDRHGSPVPDAGVRFAVTQGGGTVVQALVKTDRFGFAQTDWLLGPDLGIQTLQAEVGGLPPTQLFSYVNGDLSSVSFTATSPGVSDGVAGQPLQDMLEVRARDAQGRPVMGVGVEWTASHGTLLPASPVTDSQGRARARWVLGSEAGNQSASVQLTLPQDFAGASGVSQNVSVTFQAAATPGVPVEVSALPKRLVLELGAAARVSVAVLDLFGNRIDDLGSVGWEFDDPGIVAVGAAIDGSELFTANRIGTTRAVARVAALADTIDVLVRPVADTGGGGGGGGGTSPEITLQLSPPSLSIDVGETAGFSLLAEDGDGNPLPANDATWASDNPSVATVDAFGRVVGLSEGVAQVQATLGSVSTLGLVQVSAEAEVPEPDGPPARITDLHITDVGPTWIDVGFTASDDGTGSVALHEIRFASAPMGWGWGQASVVATGACASGFEPSAAGQTSECRVEGLSPNHTYDVQMVVWREDLDLRVYSPLSNVARGTTENDVGGGEVVSVSVVPATAVLSDGETRSFEARAYDATGERVHDLPASWSSTNEGVAVVDGSGRVTAVNPGTASIRATVAGKTGTAAISVVEGEAPDDPIVAVTVSPSATTLTTGQGADLEATAWTASGASVPSTAFVWTSTDPEVASVNGAGRVTALSTGTTTIRAVGGGHEGSAQVSVQDSGGGSNPVALEVTPGSSIITIGGSVQLAGRLLDAAGLVIPGVVFSWTSSDPGVASVDPTGLVRAVAPGTASITVSTVGFSASAQIVVLSQSGGTPWYTEQWSYGSTAAMLSSPQVSDASNTGGRVSLLTNLSGTPTGFTNAVRVHFDANMGGEPQAGVDITLPNASQVRPREVWVEFYARWSPNWVTDGPYSGNADHKFFFLFDQQPSGTRRWESHIGHFGNGIGTFIAGEGHTEYFQPNIQALWDGQWHRLRYHAKMSSQGVWEVEIDGQKFHWPGTNADWGSQYYFNSLALSRNVNRGTDRNMTLDFGPVRVYVTNPGW